MLHGLARAGFQQVRPCISPVQMSASPGRAVDPRDRPARAAKGHEDAFPRPRLSARCRFRQGTFAGTRGKGRDAPSAVIPALAPERGSSTQTGHSCLLTVLGAVAPYLHSQIGPVGGKRPSKRCEGIVTVLAGLADSRRDSAGHYRAAFVLHPDGSDTEAVYRLACGYAFSSRLISSRKRQSVCLAMSVLGLVCIKPASCSRAA